MARRARQRWLRFHSVFFTVCTFDPTSPFFAKLMFSMEVELFFLAQVCYTSVYSVLMLRKLSCSSTLPIFVQNQDGPYLNLNLASKRYLYYHMKQPAETAAL